LPRWETRWTVRPLDVTNSSSFEDAAVLEFFGASTRNHQEATMSVTKSERTTSATGVRPFTIEVPQAGIDAG
jgi:hypothetical protein